MKLTVNNREITDWRIKAVVYLVVIPLIVLLLLFFGGMIVSLILPVTFLVLISIALTEIFSFFWGEDDPEIITTIEVTDETGKTHIHKCFGKCTHQEFYKQMGMKSLE